ncbi:hypothetical protein [Dictyobacter aurantiacus]|uniref:Uncharacterized protein n=1 Tax=Dictyobacter aurantiacus TaxID=1936993 RepID=A0A401Z980_9CHLR|nr:hypothetical protein [Dictyobacter aurantiacus]GCE03389.1 hypothetical protein KDAU_07180 [Dictyobacter aurantiacus]
MRSEAQPEIPQDLGWLTCEAINGTSLAAMAANPTPTVRHWVRKVTLGALTEKGMHLRG